MNVLARRSLVFRLVFLAVVYTIQWDSKNAQIVNESDPSQYLHRKYRRGWAL